MIERPTRSTCEYLAAFGASAIYVASSPAGSPCKIGIGRDLARVREHLVAAYWVTECEGAVVVRDVHHAIRPRDGWLDASAAHVTGLLTASAGKHGITLTPHQLALDRAERARRHVDGALREANAAGKLKWFNAAYRAFRLATDPPMTYPQACARLRTAMVRCYADGREFGPGIVGEVFQGVNRRG